MSSDENFHIDVVYCNYLWVEKDIGRVLIQSSNWFLYYNDQLTAALEYNDTQTLLEPNWLYLVPPGTQAYATLISSSHQLVHYFSIPTYHRVVEPGVYKIPATELAIESVRALQQMDSDEQRGALRGQAYSNFLINYALTALDTMQSKKSTQDSRIQKAISHLNVFYSENISISDLAKKNAMSRESFSRIFKKEVGLSPYQYLTNLRMNKAKLLLHGTDHSIKHIAFNVGFKDQYQFSRLFKQWNKLSPSRYRSNILQANSPTVL